MVVPQQLITLPTQSRVVVCMNAERQQAGITAVEHTFIFLTLIVNLLLCSVMD